jgi:multicomponent Na+:H+ antiporter subunit D
VIVISLIAVPIAAALLALLVPRISRAIAIAAIASTLPLTVSLALKVGEQGLVVHSLGGWGAPLGIELRADGLSAAMVVMVSVIAAGVSVYASAFFEAEPRSSEGPTFWILSLILVASLNALFVSGDLFNLYVTLELMTIAGIGLVILGGGEAALLGAMRYLVAAFVGSMLFLLGVGLTYAGFGTLDLGELANGVAATPANAWLPIALIAGALLIKGALFPLHFWLPRAHSAAHAPVSALLSSLVVTASFYLVARLWSGAFSAAIAPAAGQLLGWLGCGAIVWGSVQAIRQRHLKVMIAYSTVAQIGYLFLLIPLITAPMAPGGGATWAQDAWSGGVYYALSHALAKAAMFLAAGAIVQAIGDDRLVGVSGIARDLPVATYAFGIAGMTLIGLPPSGGFVGKWLLLSASLASGRWWWAVAILLGGVLTAGYVFMVLGQELSLASTDRAVPMKAVPRRMEYAAMALALVSLVLGVRVTELLDLIRVGLPLPALGP